MTGSRRRGAKLDRAIFAAVFDEMSEAGYAGLTFEGVARRAETSKPVLYRRWSTKLQMVVAALQSADEGAIDAVDTGSLAGDLSGTLMRVLHQLEKTGREIALGVISDAASQPGSDALGALQTVGVTVTRGIVDRARVRGEIGAGEVPTLVLALPFDLARYQFLVDGALTESSIHEIVTTASVPLIKLYAGPGARYRRASGPS